ncbi:CCA tRNA nucleotidyltransferase [Shimia thalassica]|uniref:CCA tRNA nucleotidyltransferase n=1 Tax=Shimia thalassica TaxID=1715693 RepID=UPI0026E14514|nr:CCA tRNA nucleotidyltransferase [Shimia thalassica]MDO6523414.1 CCA tRNA nucleotidyltransferase [Shimia thalassica]
MTQIAGDWLDNPHTQAVCAMLTDAGYRALFVGGCVRNALMGVGVNDLDIATDARPEKVMNLAKAAGLNVIPTGIEHGTVTVVSGGIAHEITTFRKDIDTDGRRAVVAFSDRVEDDARRRDFTMNALYALPDGTVVDPLEGMVDLQNRRVRFIDDADMRIREDYLRILRYFRFHAWYGDADAGMDPDALAAIAANSAEIETLSKERLGSEMLKLLGAPDPAPAVAAMRSTGALGMVITGADDRALGPLVHLEGLLQAAPDAIRRLAALGGQDVAKALRLSKKQAKRCALLVEEVGTTRPAHELAYRYDGDTAVSVLLLRSALLEMPFPEDALADIELAKGAVFPVKPADLLPAIQGPALGQTLKKLETAWIKSRFSMTCEDLLKL